MSMDHFNNIPIFRLYPLFVVRPTVVREQNLINVLNSVDLCLFTIIVTLPIFYILIFLKMNKHRILNSDYLLSSIILY